MISLVTPRTSPTGHTNGSRIAALEYPLGISILKNKINAKIASAATIGPNPPNKVDAP